MILPYHFLGLCSISSSLKISVCNLLFFTSRNQAFGVSYCCHGIVTGFENYQGKIQGLNLLSSLPYLVLTIYMCSYRIIVSVCVDGVNEILAPFQYLADGYYRNRKVIYFCNLLHSLNTLFSILVLKYLSLLGYIIL